MQLICCWVSGHKLFQRNGEEKFTPQVQQCMACIVSLLCPSKNDLLWTMWYYNFNFWVITRHLRKVGGRGPSFPRVSLRNRGHNSDSSQWNYLNTFIKFLNSRRHAADATHYECMEFWVLVFPERATPTSSWSSGKTSSKFHFRLVIRFFGRRIIAPINSTSSVASLGSS